MDKLPKRKNIRLKEYNYSHSGYYFITICTNNKENLFWNIEGTCVLPPEDRDVAGETCGRQFHKPPLSDIGEIVDSGINKISSIYENVKINKYVIMPNHIHMIIVLCAENGQSKTIPTISRIIQQFKGSISKQVGFSLWQKSFYDHIIRNQQDYEEIYEYIETNPLKWEEDKYYIK
jgi:putative transposase